MMREKKQYVIICFILLAIIFVFLVGSITRECPIIVNVENINETVCEECKTSACTQVMTQCAVCSDIDCYNEIQEAITDYRELEGMFDNEIE